MSHTYVYTHVLKHKKIYKSVFLKLKTELFVQDLTPFLKQIVQLFVCT